MNEDKPKKLVNIFLNYFEHVYYLCVISKRKKSDYLHFWMSSDIFLINDKFLVYIRGSILVAAHAASANSLYL